MPLKKDSNVLFNNIAKRSDYQMVNTVFGKELNEADASDMDLRNIELERITPRSINEYGQTRIEKLAKSIEMTNRTLIHPIVVVRPNNLPEDSKVLAKYIEQGINIDKLEFIIVAGERRYRAFKFNYDKWEKEYPGSNNPYAKIPARVLSKKEAKNEEIYYKDSNDQARQLTPLEAILHIKSIIVDIKTNEDKKKAVVEMFGEKYSLFSDDEAAKKFRMDKYAIFVLERDYGIVGWSESTVRNFIRVVTYCDEKILQAVLDGKFPHTEARKICNLPHETQINLLNIYLRNPNAYFNEMSERDSEKKEKKGYSSIDVKKEIRKISKTLDASKDKIKYIKDFLPSTDIETVEKILTLINNLQSDLDEL